MFNYILTAQIDTSNNPTANYPTTYVCGFQSPTLVSNKILKDQVNLSLINNKIPATGFQLAKIEVNKV